MKENKESSWCKTISFKHQKKIIFI